MWKCTYKMRPGWSGSYYCVVCGGEQQPCVWCLLVPLSFWRWLFLSQGFGELSEKLLLDYGPTAQQRTDSLHGERARSVCTDELTHTHIVCGHVLTLMVTLTVGMTRWVQSCVQVLVSRPPRSCRVWDRETFPSLSTQDEHTTTVTCCTLERERHFKI